MSGSHRTQGPTVLWSNPSPNWSLEGGIVDPIQISEFWFIIIGSKDMTFVLSHLNNINIEFQNSSWLSCLTVTIQMCLDQTFQIYVIVLLHLLM